MPQWRQGLTKSLHQTRSVPESRYFQLASVDSNGVPYCRTVVFRGVTDDNQLVVIYPQTRKSLIMPMNPQGCWDWWGYTSDAYATSEGPQIKAVNAFIDFLATR